GLWPRRALPKAPAPSRLPGRGRHGQPRSVGRVSLALLVGEGDLLGRAGRAQGGAHVVVENALLLGRGQCRATVLAALRQLLDRALLELHELRLVRGKVRVPLAERAECGPELALGLLRVERLVDVR